MCVAKPHTLEPQMADSRFSASRDKQELCWQSRQEKIGRHSKHQHREYKCFTTTTITTRQNPYTHSVIELSQCEHEANNPKKNEQCPCYGSLYIDIDQCAEAWHNTHTVVCQCACDPEVSGYHPERIGILYILANV